MKSLSSNHMVLLLFLSTLPSFNSHVFTRAASTSPPVTRQQILFRTVKVSEEDYEEEEYENQSIRPEMYVSANKPSVHQEPPEPCKYNPCLENQTSCDILKQQTGCLCPGISKSTEPPNAPQIQDLLPVKEGPNSGKVEVQWCAPSSVVSGYRVTVEGNGSPQEFNDTQRRGFVGYLEVGTKVCVEAVNSAGHSSPTEFSCKRYERPTSFDNSLIVGILAGAVILLLLIVIGTVILCKYRICKRTKGDSNDELGNPSYTVAGTL